MPSSETRKTVSARRRVVLYIVGSIAFTIAITFSLLNIFHPNTATLKSDGVYFALQISSTPQEREIGLGKRVSLPSNQGMLFVFGAPAVQCFWMKDMHFPLDMVWVNTDKKVVHVMQNVSPATYPHVFCPDVSAEYVIELNAGQATRAHIHAGEALAF